MGGMGLRGRFARHQSRAADVRFGSKADIGILSALPPKADIGTQPRNVRFVPKADVAPFIRSPHRQRSIGRVVR